MQVKAAQETLQFKGAKREFFHSWLGLRFKMRAKSRHHSAGISAIAMVGSGNMGKQKPPGEEALQHTTSYPENVYNSAEGRCTKCTPHPTPSCSTATLQEVPYEPF